MAKDQSGFRIKGFYRNEKKEEYVSKKIYPTAKEASEWKDAFNPAYSRTRVVYEKGKKSSK